MRYCICALAAFVIVMVAGCNPPATETADFDSDAVVAEVGDWLTDYWAAWSGDGTVVGTELFDQGIVFYDDHPDFTLVSGETLMAPLDAAVSTYRPRFETVRTQTIEVEQSLIAALTGDIAHVTQLGTSYTTYLDGTVSKSDPFAYTFLLVRSNGEWRIRFQHNSE